MIGVSFMRITLQGSSVNALYNNSKNNKSNALLNNDILGNNKKRANGISNYNGSNLNNESNHNTSSVSNNSSQVVSKGNNSYEDVIKNIENDIKRLNTKIKQIRTSDMNDK